MKNKKMMITIIISVIALIGLGVAIYFGVKASQKETIEGKTKVVKLYEKIVNSKEYAFTKTLDEDNQITLMKKENQGYKEQRLNGKKKVYLVKDQNTYLLDEEEKQYYTYENNEDILSEVILSLEDFTEIQPKTGKERVDGKNYEYEEYQISNDFVMNLAVESEPKSQTKTRFYFDGNSLTYIKTIIGEKEELLKIELREQAKETNFDIPSDYVSAEEK